jgi:SlyX protein
MPPGMGLPAGAGILGIMTTSDDRLTTLEIRAAEQEKTIEELSGQIAEQWKTIEALRRKLDALTDRFLALEEQTAPEAPVTKPPHW